MITLKSYQRKAVDELKEATMKLFKNTNSNEKMCIFQAPTGSGKTVMAAKYIEEMLLNNEGTDLCFLWISVGKGELHLQSKRSLSNIFGVFPKVVLYEEEYHGSKNSLDNQSVTVINWEKLRNKDKEKNTWKNTLMKDAEYFNFREVLPNTKEQGTKIIAIIDESHIGSGAVRTSELREIIDADVWIEVSATPKSADTKQLKSIRANNDSPYIIDRNTHYVFIDADEVIKEEMIKRDVIVNENIKAYDLDQEDSQSLVLHAAYDKRLMLKDAFKSEGANINPLVLIQIENAIAGSKTVEYVYDFLIKEKKVSKDNIAIWLSGEKSAAIEYINENDNHLEFLIFKQAIDTGWDCPRAQILVKFREIQSEIFATQVLGRILRMPEQKYYTNDALNIAYIYTNLQRFDEDEKTGIPNLIKNIKSERIGTYQDISLHSFYKKRVDYGDLTTKFYEVLEQEFCNYFGLEFKPPLVNTAQNEAILLEKGIDLSSVQRLDWLFDEIKIETKNIDDVETVKAFAKNKNLDVKQAEHKLEDLLNAFLSRSLLGHFAKARSLSTLRMAVYNWFKSYLAIDPFGANKSAIRIQAILLKTQNYEVFQVAIDKALQAYQPVKTAENEEKNKESEVYNNSWEVPKEEFFPEQRIETVESSKYVHVPCYLEKGRSKTEKFFEDFLLKKGKDSIVWWWKNKDYGQDYFGIRYKDEGEEIRTFYPDYLVQFTNGIIGIFDTKDGITAETAKHKADALQLYIATENGKGKNLIGGIIKTEPNGLFTINQSSNYRYHKTEDWKSLNDFWNTLK